jgi:hypothetical protein
MQWSLIEDERSIDNEDERDEDEAVDYTPELRDGIDFVRPVDCETAIDTVGERELIAEIEVINCASLLTGSMISNVST